MSYTTPVTDRTLADIAARNSKAYFNVTDWTRIYRNAQIVNSLVEIYEEEGPISFPSVTTQTTAAIPALADFNALLLSIETCRLKNIAFYIIATTSIKHDWVAGYGQLAPTYSDVNLWEFTINVMWEFENNQYNFEVCPTLLSNLTLNNTRKVYIDCLDAANYEIDLQSTAELYII